MLEKYIGGAKNLSKTIKFENITKYAVNASLH